MSARSRCFSGEPTPELLSLADVVVADYDAPSADLVRQAVLKAVRAFWSDIPWRAGGSLPRWCLVAQRDSAAILVALEASSGDVFERPRSGRQDA